MVFKRATDVGGKCFWKCHRKPESSLTCPSLSRSVGYQFNFTNFCLQGFHSAIVIGFHPCQKCKTFELKISKCFIISIKTIFIKGWSIFSKTVNESLATEKVNLNLFPWFPRVHSSFRRDISYHLTPTSFALWTSIKKLQFARSYFEF